jgi:hypothetical protein
MPSELTAVPIGKGAVDCNVATAVGKGVVFFLHPTVIKRILVKRKTQQQLLEERIINNKSNYISNVNPTDILLQAMFSWILLRIK